MGAVGAIGLPANLSKNLSAAALYCTAHGCGATSKIELPILINVKRQAIKFSIQLEDFIISNIRI